MGISRHNYFKILIAAGSTLLYSQHASEARQVRPTLVLQTNSTSSEVLESNVVGKDCSDCPEMVPVVIESLSGNKELMVARYELTWREYMFAYDEAKCAAPRNRPVEFFVSQSKRPIIDLDNPDIRDRFPMTSIKPSEIECYINWIKKKTGNPYRLPTEHEWMAIARTGTKSSHLFVKDFSPADGYLLNTKDNGSAKNSYGREAISRLMLQEVGRYRSDSLGLYDLFGNAAEAVSNIEYFTSMSPRQKGKQLRVVVAKGWGIPKIPPPDPNLDLITYKSKSFYDELNDTIGFRLVYERK